MWRSVRWVEAVDGRPRHAPRWRLEPGVHRIRAEWASGRQDPVRVEVRQTRAGARPAPALDFRTVPA